MDEVENEDLVFALGTIVDKFGEKMAPYAFGLCQNLATAFWKRMNTAEAGEEGDDPGALAVVGCLHATSTILELVSSLRDLFIHIEPTLLPIMRRMLTTDGQGSYRILIMFIHYRPHLSLTFLIISRKLLEIHPSSCNA